VQGSGFWVQGAPDPVPCPESDLCDLVPHPADYPTPKVHSAGFRVRGVGFRVQGFEFRVWGLGYSFLGFRSAFRARAWGLRSKI